MLVWTLKDGAGKLAFSVYLLPFQKSFCENCSESYVTIFVIMYLALFLACKVALENVLYLVEGNERFFILPHKLLLDLVMVEIKIMSFCETKAQGT